VATDQDAFRFRNDDGDEAGASWMAGTNTDVGSGEGFTEGADKDFRIRLVIEATGAVEEHHQYRLQYSLNGGTWTNVTPTSSVVRSVLSANFDDEDPTTQQISTGSFVAGEMDENEGLTDTITELEDQKTEHEYMCRMLAADVGPGDAIDLRVVKSVGGTLDTYTETPTISLGVG
jgi:hypothetical protein